MNTHASPYSPAPHNVADRSSDGRYVRVGAAAMAATAAGTLVTLWLYPMVVCAVWVGMLILLGFMTSRRPAGASAS